MAKSRRRAGRASGMVVGILFLVIGVVSAAYWVTRNTPQVQLPQPKPRFGTDSSRSIPVRSPRFQTVEVYVVKASGDESVLEPVKVKVPARAGRYEAALNELLKKEGTSETAVPQGTILRSVHVSGDTAEVDLSKEFVDNFGGGSDEESLAINAIVRTVAQFGNIKRVQILVEGKKVGTLGGHFELEEPIDVDNQQQKSEDTSE